MATIDIKRSHKLSREDARGKAEELAKGMETKLGIKWRWEGEAIKFDTPSGVAKGATGQVLVGATEVRVEIDLPFLLKPLKGSVEDKVNERLNALLGPA